MIRPELVPDLKRLAPGYQPRMLMLGALESTIPGYPRGRDWFRSSSARSTTSWTWPTAT